MKFGGMEAFEVKRFKLPEQENARVRNFLVKAMLGREAGGSGPKVIMTDQKRKAVEVVCEPAGFF